MEGTELELELDLELDLELELELLSQPSGRIERVELQNRCRRFEFELELELVPPGVKIVVDSKFDLELELRFPRSGRQNCRRLQFELKLELVPPRSEKNYRRFEVEFELMLRCNGSFLF